MDSTSHYRLSTFMDVNSHEPITMRRKEDQTMNRAATYLNRAKKKLGITTDYQLAKQLGVSRGAVNNYRKKRSTFDEYTAFQIAEILEIDPAIVIANIKAETEKDEFKREFWEEKVRQFGQVAVLTILVTNTLLQITKAMFYNDFLYSLSTIYILC